MECTCVFCPCMQGHHHRVLGAVLLYLIILLSSDRCSVTKFRCAFQNSQESKVIWWWSRCTQTLEAQEPKLKAQEQVTTSRNGHALSAPTLEASDFILVSSVASNTWRSCQDTWLHRGPDLVRLLLNWELLLAENNPSDDDDKEKAFLTTRLNAQCVQRM